ncbi:MFS transporter [Legionella taurinensis]|uniref:MFS transporter n=1 Tax=Legionella taurinensis TaxID=70611 RepID=A0A3A5L8N6_9GAMM|nr:MFS transporter [Legionella taurinensis]MDX1838348.1 MFS transporter [Legionella taurinensis]PUT39111.1 MFS transporter [Legionella taurinensis]PUT39565.1 MFS transporter [Legionella taurinensis]PUT43567.1 MFS transporter [Legionella taurinensis]PUT45221.1 MFS transporter [Legionella taurinensis]
MTNVWTGIVFPITYLYLVRIMGVFLFTPIFSASIENISHATPFLVGVAIGIFGLTQAILQIPFGLWSDKFGRKKLINIGLYSYLLGSVLGIMAGSIYTLILARVVQGLGAISAVLSALMVDLTPESVRLRAFVFIGIMIAILFMVCMVTSPLLVDYFGLSVLFYILAGLSLIGLMINQYVIPNPGKNLIPSIERASIRDLLKDKKLSVLNHSILIQHLLVCSTFYAVPIVLKHLVQRGELSSVFYFYAPALSLSFVLIVPLIRLSEKYRLAKPFFLLAIAIYSVIQFSMGFKPGILTLILLFTLYFVAFNFIESNLYAFISNHSSPATRGTVLGLFNSYQFFGFFLGGVCAGVIDQFFSLHALFIFNGLLTLVWFFYSFRLFKQG